MSFKEKVGFAVWTSVPLQDVYVTRWQQDLRAWEVCQVLVLTDSGPWSWVDLIQESPRSTASETKAERCWGGGCWR